MDSKETGWITIPEMAARIGKSKRTIQRMISKGELSALGQGQARLVWAASGHTPIQPAPDIAEVVAELEAFSESFEPGSTLEELCLHLCGTIREVNFSEIGSRMRAEIEATGAAFAHALMRARKAAAKGKAKGWH